jgi:hypothetical protein
LLETVSTSAATPVNRLVVIDANGKVLRRVESDVRRFVFSPNGRKLACIEGTFYAGGIGFRPEGAFIVDIDGTEEPRELPGLEKPHDLHWLTTPTENSVYFRVLRKGEDQVLRWDVKAQQLKETALDGIRFSPDGKFLLRKPHETAEVGDCEPGTEGDSCLRVTEVSSGRELAALAAQKGAPHGWVYNRGHHLLFIERNPQTETITERRGARDFQAELITGYSPNTGFVFEVGSDRPPVVVTGIVAGDSSAGDWVTGDSGVILTSGGSGAAETSGGGASFGEPVAVCERLPCETRGEDEAADEDEGERVTLAVGPTAPEVDRLDPAQDATFQYANPRFRWAPVTGASWYRLEVCSDRECDAAVGGSEKISGTEWRSGGLPVGELYWRLAAVADSDSGGPVVGELTPPTRFFVHSEQADHTPPTAEIETSAGPGASVVKEGRSLTAPAAKIVPRIADDLSGVEWWRADIDGQPAVDSREGDVTAFEGPRSNGPYQVNITAKDRAGNVSTVASARFVVDARPPRLLLQPVTTETLLGGRVQRSDRSRLSTLDFEWFALSDSSELGIASVFFDRPGRVDKRGRDERRGSREPLAYRSSWPELVLFVRGEWPFSAPLEELEGEELRLLWLAATDDDSGVSSVELRTVTNDSPSGETTVIEILATDLVGNVSPPLTLELTP